MCTSSSCISFTHENNPNMTVLLQSINNVEGHVIFQYEERSSMWGKQALSRSSRSLRKWTSNRTNGMDQCRLRSVCGSSSVRCAAAVLGNVSFASIVANLLILVMAKEIKLPAKMPGISQRNQCTSECDYSGTDERRPVLVVHWRYHLIQLVWGTRAHPACSPAALRSAAIHFPAQLPCHWYLCVKISRHSTRKTGVWRTRHCRDHSYQKNESGLVWSPF